MRSIKVVMNGDRHLQFKGDFFGFDQGQYYIQRRDPESKSLITVFMAPESTVTYVREWIE